METQKKEEDIKKKKMGFFKKFILIFLLFFAFLVSVFTAILYIPLVQNWTVNIITSTVNRNLNGSIEIGKIRFNVFKGLVIRDVNIIDATGLDTLLHAENLNASLRDNLTSLFKKKLHLKTIEITGVSLTDIRGKEDAVSKLSQLFERKGDEDIPKKDNQYVIDINKLVLNKISYSYIDSVNGKVMTMGTNYGKIDFINVDLKGRTFLLDQIELKEPLFSLHRFQGSPFEIVEEELIINDSTYSVPDTFHIFSKSIRISDGAFNLTDGMRTTETIENAFNSGDIHLEKMDFQLNDFKANSFAELSGEFESGSLTTRDEQLDVQEFQCGVFALDNRRMTFDSLYIKTSNSEIRDRLIFKYREIGDFQDFINKVIIEGNIVQSQIGIEDLLYFVPSLKSNPYLKRNIKNRFSMNALITGRINALNANDVNIRLGNEIVLQGRLASRNITDTDNALLNLDMQNFSIRANLLNEIIPGLNLPENFNKLGRVQFKGRFDGYFQDFVSFGNLNSDIGTAQLDMRLDLKQGVANAQFSGKGQLNNFNLGVWTGNSDFGIVDMSAQVEDGKGLRLENVQAKLKANVNKLEYRDYVYEDFSMDGAFEQNLFDGFFAISEPNIDLNFEGTVDFTDSIPLFDFVAKVNALKLKALNLSKEDFEMQGNLRIQGVGTDQNNAEGRAQGKNFIFFRDGNAFALDSFDLSVKGAYPNSRTFVLSSSLVDLELNGFFKIEELPDAFISGLKTNYPSYTKGLTYITYENPTPGFDFNISAKIKESEDIFEVLFGQSIFMRDAILLGRISDVSKRSAVDIDFPYLEINGNVFEGIKGDLFAYTDEGELNLSVQHGNFLNVEFGPVIFAATIDREGLFFTTTTEEILDSFTNVKLEGTLSTRGELFKVNIQNSGFNAFGSRWSFNNVNNILFGKDRIAIDDLFLSDGDHTLTFDDINEKGVNVKIEEINIGFFNRMISREPIDMRGFISGHIDIDNIFDFQGIDADLEIPGFGFRDHDFGNLLFEAVSKGTRDPVSYKLFAIDNDKDLNVTGSFNMNTKENSGNINVTNYPIDLLEYILTDGISETIGTATGAINFEGPWNGPKLFGEVVVSDGATRIDYIGVTYAFGKNKIKFEGNLIDFTGSELLDSRGQSATITGSLSHDGFKDWSTNIRLVSPQIIALNTTKEENPTYYGFAQGNIDVSFTGPFENIDIFVNATTGRNTILNIPVEYTTDEIGSSFIEIISKEASQENVQYTPISLSGINLDMNVNVTQEAEVVIIFDEAAKDILKSRGRGPIQLSIDPEGNFEMFGAYEVVGGEYLFTIPSLLVNKSFILRSGGDIQWTGDPLNANLNIKAEYKGLQASLEPFIAEYIPEGNDRLLNQAKLSTDVALTMDLSGTLLSPSINFEIGFPNLTGELKPLAEGKLRTLEGSPDAYNDQVFGLLLLRTFLPSNNPLANNFLQAGNLTESLVGTGFNTISEFLSNQFSILLSSLFEEALGENTYLTGIDVDFSASNSFVSGDGSILPDQYDFNLSSSFDENKWNIQIGGKYVRVNSILNLNEYFVPNFVFEYYISEDRRLKLNVFARSDYDNTNAARVRKLQSGVGLSYRREFNSLFEFANNVNNEAKAKNN